MLPVLNLRLVSICAPKRKLSSDSDSDPVRYRRTFVKWFSLEEDERFFPCIHTEFGERGQRDCANEIYFYEYIHDLRNRRVHDLWVQHIPRTVAFSRSAKQLPIENVVQYHPPLNKDYQGSVAYIQLVYIDGRTLFDLLKDQSSFDACVRVAKECFAQIQPVVTGLNQHKFNYFDLHANQYLCDSAGKWWLIDLNVERTTEVQVQFPNPDDMFSDYMSFANCMVSFGHMSGTVLERLEKSGLSLDTLVKAYEASA